MLRLVLPDPRLRRFFISCKKRTVLIAVEPD